MTSLTVQKNSKYAVFDNLDIGVIVIEQHQEIESEFYLRYLNRRIEKFVNSDFRENVTLTVRNTFPKAYEYKMHLAFIKCLRSQAPLDMGELLYGDENMEPQYIDVKLIPESQNTLILYSNNVTERVIRIKELEVQNKELTHFAHVVSHDIVEPINTIQSYIDIFSAKFPTISNSPQKHYLDIISQSATRMKALVCGLLNFSKLNQPQEWLPINLTQLILEVTDDLGSKIEQTQAQIYVQLLPEILGQPIQIRSLFQNLIANAIKFHKSEEAPQIEIGHHEKIDFWHFYVKDSGIGIPSNKYEDVFLMFEKLHGKFDYEGAGIGLAHCQKIVKLHLGEIWIESEDALGTTIHFTIPKAPIVPKTKKGAY